MKTPIRDTGTEVGFCLSFPYGSKAVIRKEKTDVIFTNATDTLYHRLTSCSDPSRTRTKPGYQQKSNKIYSHRGDLARKIR